MSICNPQPEPRHPERLGDTDGYGYCVYTGNFKGFGKPSDGGLETALIINIVGCLVLGKSIGLSAVIFLARKLKLIVVTEDITNKQIMGVPFLAGIGFTLAIFIAGSAFNRSPEYIDSAKIGIFIGSFISAIIGFMVLRYNSVKGKFDHTPKG